MWGLDGVALLIYGLDAVQERSVLRQGEAGAGAGSTVGGKF